MSVRHRRIGDRKAQPQPDNQRIADPGRAARVDDILHIGLDRETRQDACDPIRRLDRGFRRAQPRLGMARGTTGTSRITEIPALSLSRPSNGAASTSPPPA
jgi:hypothetical protein